MRLTYDIDEKDLQSGTRRKIISNTLSTFRVEDRDGELVLDIPEERYGDALYSFVQALLRVADVSFLSRERVRSTFMEDFQALLGETVPDDRRIFDWHDPEHDSQGMYSVDLPHQPDAPPPVRPRPPQRPQDPRRYHRPPAVREVGACVPVVGHLRRPGVDQSKGAGALQRRL